MTFTDIHYYHAGSKAEENINTWLKEANNTNYLNKANLTSHCTRKGSASYVSSLSGLANVLAVVSRGGWRFPGVLPIYITQENGGDQMVSDYFLLFETVLVCSTLTLLSRKFVPGWSQCLRSAAAYPGLCHITCPLQSGSSG